MTNMNIYKSLGALDPALIMKAAPAEEVQTKKKNNRATWTALAACFATIGSRTKKILILMTALTVLFSVIFTVCYASGIFNINDPETWFEEAQNGGIDDDLTKKIRVGMTLEEVVAILGKPQRDTGSGVLLMEWDLKSGKIFVVAFNSKPVSGQATHIWIAFHTETKEE